MSVATVTFDSGYRPTAARSGSFPSGICAARAVLPVVRYWYVPGGHAGVQLVTGPGGMGKTRQALRLGEKLAVRGWQPLWIPRGSERDAVAAVYQIGQPCVLMVDTPRPAASWLGC